MIVTGIGSLPHADEQAAAEFVAATTDLPYLPQLPNRDPAEAMLAQWGDGLCGCAARDGMLLAGAAGSQGADPFGGARAYLQRHGEGITRLKTQATGPITLAMAMVAGGHDESTVWECVVPGVVGRIRDHLAEIALHCPDAAVTLMLDEPSLAAFGPDRHVSAPTRDRLVGALGAVIGSLDVAVGIHCCADTDWSIVTDAGAAVISWDVLELGRGLRVGAEDVASAIAAGTLIAWGVVPVVGTSLPATDELVSRYRRSLAELVFAGAPVSPMREEAWVTPACGLVGLTVDQAEKVMERVRAVAEVVDGG